MTDISYPYGRVCYSKDENVRMSSSSGGMFYEIAKYVLDNLKGCVYGAAFSKKNSVEHVRIEEVIDISKLMTSKYVQSDLKNAFEYVKKDLENKKFVMFVGTPCQVAGISSYLKCIKADMSKLILVDFICHGVPSPTLWTDYIAKMEDKYGASVTKVNFRNKKNGWHDYHMELVFDNGRKYYKSHYLDEYMQYFLNDCSLRKCCINCAFAEQHKKKSDITLADAWLYREKDEFGGELGCSLAVINKSETVIKSVFESCVSKNVELNGYFNENSYIDNEKIKRRDLFYKDYLQYGFTEKLRNKYISKKVRQKGLLKHLIYKIKYYNFKK